MNKSYTIAPRSFSLCIPKFYLTLCVCLFAAFYANAGGTYYLTVGQSQLLQFSTTRDIQTSIWVAYSPNVEVTSSGDKYAFIKALEPWTAEKPLVVRCDYYYSYKSGNFTYTGRGYEDFYIYVNPINPTNVSLPSSKNLQIGGSVTLIPTLTPSNAETEFTWSSSNTSVATVSDDGYVKALSAGSTTISVRTGNGLMATSVMTVTQPTFSLNSWLPVNSSINVQTSTQIWAQFSLPLYKGSQFSSIYLYNETGGKKVDGLVTISGYKLIFTPAKVLESNSVYKFVIPSGAVANQWGTAYTSEAMSQFKTRVLEIVSSDPLNNSDTVSVSQLVVIKYNDIISAGKQYNEIQLIDVSANCVVPSLITISGVTLAIKPNLRLKNRTQYKVVIPENALTNEEDISLERKDSLQFTTNEKIVLTASSNGGLIPYGDSVYLYSNVEGARIHYSINGITPNSTYSIYSRPITIVKNMTIKAIAYKEGFENSEVLTANFRALTLRVINCFPENNAKFVRNDLSLSYKFNEPIKAGKLIDSISLRTRDAGSIPGKIIISGEMLFFVPDAPLDTNEIYELRIPTGSVENHLAEPNAGFIHKFTTGLLYTSVSVGRNYTTATKSNGTLWAWGDNSLGQLGDSTTIPKKNPVEIMKDVISVSSRGYHTVVIKADGSLWAWGCNQYGQLGNGTNLNSNIPVHIMDGVTTVSADSSRTFAIRKDGSLWGWGGNAYGRLGDGSTINRTKPVKIMDSVTSVSAGGFHSVAIKSDGSLWAWGLNASGRLGDGTAIDRTIPVKILDSVEAVSAGNLHTLAIKRDGSLWAWGVNTSGQLGDNTSSNKAKPTKILDSIALVSAGGNYSLAVKKNGSLWAWGGNSSNQLGDGSIIDKTYPSKVADSILAISAGWDRSMAIKQDGTLWGWGENKLGQLGDGSSINIGTPTQVLSNTIPYEPLTGIHLNTETMEILKGSTTVLIANEEPYNAEIKSIQWTSSDESVAIVSSKGELSGLSVGSTIVTVTVTTSEDLSYSADCNIVVADAPNLSGTVKITGKLAFGEILIADVSAITVNSIGKIPDYLMYQWTRDGKPIPGELANQPSYKLSILDVGHKIGVIVSAMGSNGVVSSTGSNVVGKASIDLSVIQFNDLAVNYDGESHSIYIEGNLPRGLSVDQYIGNDKTEVGQYTVIVKFGVSDTNGFLIPEDLSAVLTIKPAKPSVIDYRIKEGMSTQITAWSEGNLLRIRGIPLGTHWFVYDSSGKMVYEGVARKSEETFEMEHQGRYFIKFLNRTTVVGF